MNKEVKIKGRGGGKQPKKERGEGRLRRRVRRGEG